MAIISKEIWDKAKAMFEGGASLKDINYETNIDKSTVSKKAKKEGWEKGKNSTVIQAEAMVIAEKSTMNQPQLNYHNNEVDRLTKDTRMIHGLTKGNLSGISRHIKAGRMGVADHKKAQDMIDKASVTLGVSQRFSTQASTVINNQQNTQVNYNDLTDEEIAERLRHFDEK